MAVEHLSARASVWMHFASIAGQAPEAAAMMVRGEGAYVFDESGKRYFDALAALYCVNVGHGRAEIADAIAAQARELAFHPLWGRLTPPAVELAGKIAERTPADLNRVFFTSGGSESVDAAWKLTRQYHRLRGKADKTKVLARQGAYHGTTLGALSVSGVPTLQEPFKPLVPGGLHGPKVDAFHAEGSALEHSLQCADAMAEIVEAAGPDTVGAIFVEPVQNSGGCLVAEPEYFARLRAICDEYDLLLISDETICSWGRLGTWFGCDALGYTPDIITTAKGLTSAYVPMGAVIASNRVAEPFLAPGVRFDHGLTFGGHPVAAAAALANIAIIEDEGLCERALSVGAEFREALETLRELPIVGDVRGLGMFQAVELVSDRATKAPFSADATAALTDFIPARLFEAGVICRAMHRGAPVLQFAPPLVASGEQLHELVETLRDTLAQAQELL
jgi:adenosylmethionine-8-amino-7-oxononanoate aminotransferase